ncbi:MAG: saccharopine dehydrogenase [Rhodothermaeota bacterium MED-G16]|nr:MAG: saccharopine dehydrogenase [Rhodothermaeota bacterium MED-G16]
MSKKIVILGAGKSSSYLIKYLYDKRKELNISLNVFSDYRPSYIDEFNEINFTILDIKDKEKLIQILKGTYIVVSLLPPFLHFEIAKICSKNKINMITASYLDEKIKTLEKSFIENDCFLFMEMGLDPGIDHMSAMKMIDKLNKSNKIIEFESYTGGLVKLDKKNNPWGYKFTWNPMNVILAGAGGAKYLKEGISKSISYDEIFKDLTSINIPENEYFEGYANRDSLKYKSLYNLNDIKTLKRGTLRHKGFCETWSLLIDLRLTSNSKTLYNDDEMTFFDFFNYNIKAEDFNGLKKVLDEVYGIKKDSQVFKNLEWSGFFSNKKISIKEGKFSDFLLSILLDKWTLSKGDIDLIVMTHSFIYKSEKKINKLISYLRIEGDDNIYTAMSKTVGLPMAVLIEHILKNGIDKKGIQLPFNKDIYNPILKKLKKLGIGFKEIEINI